MEIPRLIFIFPVFFLSNAGFGNSISAPEDDGWKFHAADLSYISNVVTAKNGQVFVISAPDGMVFALDRNGESATEFGNPGNGPGEFLAPFQANYLPKSNSLVVADGRKLKFLQFQADGKFVRSWAVPQIQLSGLVFGDELVAFTNDRLAVSEANQGVTLFTFEFDHGNPLAENNKENWRTLLEFDAKAHADPQKMPGKGNNFIRFPWTPRVLMAKSSDDRHLYIGSNVRIDFAKVDIRSGKVVAKIQNDLSRHKLEDEEIDAYLSRKSNSLRASYRAGQFNNPDFKPVAERIFVDRDNRLWIKLQPAFKAAEAEHVIIQESGSILGRISLPTRVKLVDADRRFLWMYYFDEANEVWVIEKRAYQLKKAG